MNKLVLEDYFPMMSTEEIMNHFEKQLKVDDGLELTPQQKVEIIYLFCHHPILKVMCSCLESYGYDNCLDGYSYDNCLDSYSYELYGITGLSKGKEITK